MREGWKVKRLSQVSKIIMGQSPKGSSYNTSGQGTPLINGPVEFGATQFSRTKKTKFTTAPTKMCMAGDLILCVRGSTTGKMNIAGFDSCIGRGVAAIRAIEHQDWINFFIHANRENIYRLGSGATFPNVSGAVLSKLEVPIPPVPEQKRIATILDEAFAGIATAVANTEKNLTNSRELFESYLQAVFTQKEEGWAEKKLGDIATFRNGLNFTKNSKGELIKIVGVKDFQNDFWVPMDQLQSVRIDGELSELDALQNGDILTVRSNGNKDLIGRCILADQVPDKISHSGFTIRIRIKTDEVYHPYIVHFLKSKESRKQLTEIGGGVNISSLNQQGLSSLMISYPSFSDQKTIVAKIDDLAAETERLAIIYQHKLTTLADLKQSLLHKAFSGALTSQSVSALQEAVA